MITNHKGMRVRKNLHHQKSTKMVLWTLLVVVDKQMRKSFQLCICFFVFLYLPFQNESGTVSTIEFFWYTSSSRKADLVHHNPIFYHLSSQVKSLASFQTFFQFRGMTYRFFQGLTQNFDPIVKNLGPAIACFRLDPTCQIKANVPTYF